MRTLQMTSDPMPLCIDAPPGMVPVGSPFMATGGSVKYLKLLRN